MRGVNKVILVGTIGRDAEVRQTNSGKSVANFSVATTESYGKGDDRKESTEWHSIVLWGNSGVVRHLLKGTSVYIEGRIQTRSWENKEGVKVYRTEINAFNVVLLGSKKRQNDDDNGWGGRGDTRNQERQTRLSEGDDERSSESHSDDIPF